MGQAYFGWTLQTRLQLIEIVKAVDEEGLHHSRRAKWEAVASRLPLAFRSIPVHRRWSTCCAQFQYLLGRYKAIICGHASWDYVTTDQLTRKLHEYGKSSSSSAVRRVLLTPYEPNGEDLHDGGTRQHGDRQEDRQQYIPWNEEKRLCVIRAVKVMEEDRLIRGGKKLNWRKIALRLPKVFTALPLDRLAELSRKQFQLMLQKYRGIKFGTSLVRGEESGFNTCALTRRVYQELEEYYKMDEYRYRLQGHSRKRVSHREARFSSRRKKFDDEVDSREGKLSCSKQSFQTEGESWAYCNSADDGNTVESHDRQSWSERKRNEEHSNSEKNLHGQSDSESEKKRSHVENSLQEQRDISSSSGDPEMEDSFKYAERNVEGSPCRRSKSFSCGNSRDGFYDSDEANTKNSHDDMKGLTGSFASEFEDTVQHSNPGSDQIRKREYLSRLCKERNSKEGRNISMSWGSKDTETRSIHKERTDEGRDIPMWTARTRKERKEGRNISMSWGSKGTEARSIVKEKKNEGRGIPMCWGSKNAGTRPIKSYLEENMKLMTLKRLDLEFSRLSRWRKFRLYTREKDTIPHAAIPNKRMRSTRVDWTMIADSEFQNEFQQVRIKVAEVLAKTTDDVLEEMLKSFANHD